MRLNLRDLRFSYPAGARGSTVAGPVLHGVTLEVPDGEFFTLLGPSGCGKTTLLWLLAGFLHPTGGSIEFDGQDVVAVPPERRGVGIVFQNYALFPHLSVFENVAFGLRTRRVPKAEIAPRVREALELVNLHNVEERRPGQLSGGQQQRVALARAVAPRPSLLLMDEPLSNLDAALRLETRDRVRELQRRLGITTVYVTHDQEEALAQSDRLAVMSAGRLLQVGTPEALYEEPACRFVASFLGRCNLLPAWPAGPGRLRIEGIGEADAAWIPAAPSEGAAPCQAPEPGAPPHWLAVRPESLRLVDAATSDTPLSGDGLHLAARVEGQEYLGETRLLRLSIGDSRLEMALHGVATRQRFELGQSITVWLDWRATRLVSP